MLLGSASLGSTTLGGAAASNAGLFFAPTESLNIGVYRRTQEYTGEAEFFVVETRMNFEIDETDRLMRVYSHNDPGETPQLQVTVGVDTFYTQSIVGAARFIVVELELFANLSPIGITISGNEYFQ